MAQPSERHLYRSLYLKAYAAVRKADPDAKILIGETSPYARKGLSVAPLAFLREMGCVNKKYKRTRSCPKLQADGFAHHPYDFYHAPNFKYPGADNATLGTLSHLTRALDRLSRAGSLRKTGGGKLPLYLTEFGYFASGHRALSASKRSKYLPQAYGMALKNTRVKSFLQYLLVTPPKRFDFAFFNTALITSKNKTYPQYRSLKRWYGRNKSRVKRPTTNPVELPAARWCRRALGGAGGSGQARRERLARARLYFVTDLRHDVERVVAAALAGGVDMVQLRDKDAERRRAAQRGRVFRRPLRQARRALLAERPARPRAPRGRRRRARGPGRRARRGRALAGGRRPAGGTLDALAGAARGRPRRRDADQLSVGPVWETPTKLGRPAAGLEYVRHAAERAGGRPWFAIGGIDLVNVRQVTAAGAERIVVVRAIRDAADPTAAAAALRAALEPRTADG